MTNTVGSETDESSPGTRPAGLVYADRHLEGIVTALVTLPFLVAAVTMLISYRDFAPFADIALIELGIRDVGRHLVLLGVYSRFGWRHPGPLLFYVLAAPYWLSGGSSGGMYAGAALLNGACVVAVAWLAHRRGGRQLLLVSMLFVAVLAHTTTPDLWTDPWNPSLAAMPLMVFVFGCWSLADGDDTTIPILVVTGTFCVQSHLGYVWFIAAALAVAATSRVMLGWARGRSRTAALDAKLTDGARIETDEAVENGALQVGRAVTGRLRRALIVSAVLGTVLWLPPLIDQVVHQPGNLRELASFARVSSSQYGLADGVRFIRFELGPQPAWVFGELPGGWLGLIDPSNPPIPIGGVLLVGAAAFAAWRRDWSGARLSALGLALIAASVFAISRIGDGLFPYLVRWSPVVGLVTWLAVVWVGWRAIRNHLASPASSILGAVVVAATIGVSALNLVAGATTPPHDADKSPQIQAFTAQIVPRLDPSRPVVVNTPDPTGGVEALYMLSAVVLQLERQGFDVRVDDPRFTNRASSGDEPQVVSLHHVAPDAPTVPALSGVQVSAAQDDFVAWVTDRR